MNHDEIIQTVRADSRLRWHVIADSTANARAAYEATRDVVDGETFAEAASIYRADYRAGRV